MECHEVYRGVAVSHLLYASSSYVSLVITKEYRRPTGPNTDGVKIPDFILLICKTLTLKPQFLHTPRFTINIGALLFSPEIVSNVDALFSVMIIQPTLLRVTRF